uniref:Beta-eudesmol synthase n=1 Tax=Zingiber zerumbet TaxID=311405 RepID=TPSBE_ZINZE|nr:RecName: Full=Beta-eudesmol synthase; AltName: Full=10-epi-gamma-eudesmol synthase; AltName: Full=Alpha-eudesmol synthase [Zingiber zerumbet]BAG12021.1 beta-eudesmol synthase [Zingiber zerumbet]BAG12022.1 beta-eudesmol synthase [Zingiber zerumbet]
MEKQSLTFDGDEEAKIDRKSSKYHPSIWGDYFIQNSSLTHAKESTQRMIKRVEELKVQVKSMFKDTSDLLQLMNLINSIQMLGLDYHFENEIDEALRLIYEVDDKSYGLYETSLRFQLLRQHGYHVSADIFNKFKDDNGSFISSLNGDAKGLLSLYNVSYLGTHGETILDEAKSFTKPQLVSLMSELEQSLAAQVSLFLELPLCRRNKILLARKYILIYQEDAMRNNVILELAKLNFNLLQSLYQEELKKISIWWNDLAFAKSLSFTRDRVVEGYYWVLTIYFEPQHSRARVICSKVFAFLSIMDDIYDNYGILEECTLLTEAIKRWNPQAIDGLPEYLKDYYLKLLKTFEEFEDELELNEKYRMLYLQDEVKALAISYLQEAKWGIERHVPSLDEHLHNSLISSGSSTVICASFVGMGEVATKEVFDWLSSFPKVVEACCVIGRLLNDIRSHELEQGRDHTASTVESYMKEHDTNVDVACEKLREIVEKAWKDLNNESLNPTKVPRLMIERIVNLSKSNEEIYKYNDTYTNSDTTMKDNISLVLVESCDYFNK